jgi:uncharacterized protein (TIGR02466 family)
MHIHQPHNRCELYITQSWLNFTDNNQYHAPHLHTNSIYSAVLYLNVVEGDCIEFTRTTAGSTFPDVISTTYNSFNCRSWRVPVKNNMVIVFPSNLPHNVPPVAHNETRVSLAFNTFVRGELGAPLTLNHLHLP